MIKYYCNRCGNQIKKSDVLLVQTQASDGVKSAYHFCRKCSGSVIKLLAEPANENGDDRVSEQVVSEECADDVTTYETPNPVDVEFAKTAAMRPRGVDRTRMPDPMAECKASDGRDVTEIFDNNVSVMYMERMPEDLAMRYLVPYVPDPLSVRLNMVETFSMLISFYRGNSAVYLRQKYHLASQQVFTKLCSYVSMRAYERWFSPIPELINSDGVKIDQGAVLAAVQAMNSYKDILSDTQIDDKRQLFSILEYYLCFNLSEQVRDKYISDAGGE